MTLEEMRSHEWTIGWSGGKDSTTTIILCHEYGIPIKEIIYIRMMYDEKTPATLPIMVDFVDKAKEVFKSWGYKVRIEKSKETAKELIDKKYKRSKKYPERNGKPYGITAFARGHCIFTKVKTDTIALLNSNEYEMVGYSADEKHRLGRLTDTKQSIMAVLGITKKDTFEICRKYGLLSPLYDLGFYRDGCWFCPNAGVDQRNYLRKNNPELIAEIKESIDMCDYDISSIRNRNNWLKDY